jgi:CHAP domain-containing protein
MPYMTPAGLAKLAALGITEQDLRDWQTVVGTKPDGDPGPLTFAATVNFLRARGWLKAPTITSDARARVVRWAEGQVGVQDPDKYWKIVGPDMTGDASGTSWCGGFALWCLTMAGLVTWKWVRSKGFVYDGATQRLPTTQLPEPGDIAYFAHNQHYAIVRYVQNGRVYLVNGNGMLAPKEGVTLTDRPITEATVYYSIRNLA